MKGLIILVILFGLFLSGILLYYFKYQKPAEQQLFYSTYNISILTYEIINNKKVPISTKINIVLDESNVLYESITTSVDGYTLIKIPSNHTFALFNENIENQTYYTLRKRFILYDTNDLQRVDFEVERYGDLIITQPNALQNNNSVFLNIKSIGTHRFFNFCYRWSSNLLNVVTNTNFIATTPPKRLIGKVDKCYLTYTSLFNTNITVPFYYNTFSNDDLEIKVWILDGDIRYYSINTEYNGLGSYLIEDDKGDNIGKGDIIYVIK